MSIDVAGPSGILSPVEEMPAERWAAVAGRWKFDGNRASFLGPHDSRLPKQPGIALSSVRLRDGRFWADVMLSRNKQTSGGFVLGYQSERSSYASGMLGGFDAAYAISYYRPDFGWVPIVRAGLLDNLESQRPYRLEVAVQGQTVRMRVDDVEIATAVFPQPLVGTGFGLFTFDDAPVEFQKVAVRRDRPRVFVIMPFAEPFDTLYRDVIKPEAESLEFEIVRVDEIHGPGIILDDIRRQIEAAHVVVAEISRPNPNVFYELGYAHALGKPSVLLVRREQGNAMPFDVRGFRAIFYDDTIGGKNAVQRALRDHLNAIVRDA